MNYPLNWLGIFAQVEAHANDMQPQECCGVILVTGEVVKLDNVFDPPELRNVRFAVDRVMLRRIDPSSILAVYHSHPNASAWPSDTDAADAATWPGKLSLIVGMKNGTAYETRVFQNRVHPATNRVMLMASQPAV